MTAKQDLSAGAGCPKLLRDGDLGPWPAGRTGNNDAGEEGNGGWDWA
jgi:hypothetical protein